MLAKELFYVCYIDNVFNVKIQFVPRNWRQGFPHMQNAVNGPNTSLISQTPIVSSTRMGFRNSPSSPIAAFASLLASASPDQQHTVSIFIFCYISTF